MNRATDKCDWLLDYMLGELDDGDRQAFEEYLSTAKDCASEFNSLWPVHQRLLTVLPHTLTEVTTAKKSLVLKHAFTVRPAIEQRRLAPASENTRVAGRQRQNLGNEHALRAGYPRKTLWNSTLLRRGSVVVGLLLIITVGGLWGTQIGFFSHVKKGTASPHPTVSKHQVLSVALKASSSYPASLGEIQIIRGQQESLVVKVRHVPVQSKWACYDVWAISGSKVSSLGEFLVDQNGSGGTTISLSHGTTLNGIKITLEPQWGDPAPLGPTVLKSSGLTKLG